MRDGTVVTKKYGNETLARIDHARLQAQGIEAWVETDNCDGMYPQMDVLLGVKLLVRQEDAERASDLLATQAEFVVEKPWTCPGCGEHIDAGFDTCWKCGVGWTP